MDSTGSVYEDVYPIEDESQLDFDEDEHKPANVVQVLLSYNPYINVNSLRGGGPPLIYRLVASFTIWEVEWEVITCAFGG